MFAVLSMALSVAGFAVTTPNAQAADEVVNYDMCFNPSNGQIESIKKANANNTCTAPFQKETGFTNKFPGVCVVKDDVTNLWMLTSPTGDYKLNGTGTGCLFNDNNEYAGDFVRFPQFPVDPPPTDPKDPVDPIKPKPKPTNGGTNGGSTPQVQGNCETGFHTVGPLCVPNGPGFGNDSIANANSAGGLAIKIIRFLLYFAGIVAVIMIIIGGYQVLTAAGNDTQAANGKKTLTNAIIGLIIIILAYVIVQAVIGFVTKGS